MSDLSQESLLREIDEDIRRERFAKLWKQYGTYVIAAVVLLLAGVAGYKIWQEQAIARRGEAAEQFTAAVALAGKDRVAAEERLRTIAKDGPSGYAMLAAFQQAALLAKSGDRQAARNAYQALQRSAGDPIYRDLAIVAEAMVALEGEAVPIDADAIRDKLQPLTLDGNPWRFSCPRVDGGAGLGRRTNRRGEGSAECSRGGPADAARYSRPGAAVAGADRPRLIGTLVQRRKRNMLLSVMPGLVQVKPGNDKVNQSNASLH